MSEHIKLNDAVYFTANFYHPTSGFSYAADATPRYLVHESGAALILQGNMVSRGSLVGSYYGNFVASTANGFVDSRYYDVQVSGTVAGVSGFGNIKDFVLGDLYDVNVVKVSGVYVDYGTVVEANVIQVSGVNVSLPDFNTSGSSGASAADVRAEMDANSKMFVAISGQALTVTQVRTEMDLSSLKLTAISGSVAGLAGAAMRGTDNAATATNLMAVSGVLVTRTTDSYTAGSVWNAATASYGTTGTYGELVEGINTAVVAGVASSLTATASGIITGTHIGGSFDSTYVSNGVYWTTAPVTPAVGGFGLNAYLDYTTVANQTVNNVTIRGYFSAGAGRNTNVYAYNWNTATWDQISDAVTRMNNASTNQLYTYTLLSSHQNATPSASGVRIGFRSASTTVADRLNIDQAIVGVATAGASAADIANAVWLKTAALNYGGGVWIDTIAGASGTSIQDSYGSPTKPVKYYDQAITIADTLGVKRLYLRPASSISLTQNHDNWRFIGAGNIDFGGQSIANAVFEDLYTASGISTGDDIEFNRCGIGNATISHGYFRDCIFKDTLTFVADNDYIFLNCSDARAGSDTSSTFVFKPECDAVFRDWRGGIQINGMDQTNSAIIDGAGRIVIDSTSKSGEISVRGHFPTITGASTFTTAPNGGSISQTARFSTDNPISTSGIVEANVTQVSGQYVSIENFRADLSNIDNDIYFASIKYVSDETNLQDEYAVYWFKNDQPVSSGSLTNPRLSVYDAATGTAKFAGQSMNYASVNLGVVTHTESTNVISSGHPYLVEASGTIDGSLRSWRSIVGIDIV